MASVLVDAAAVSVTNFSDSFFVNPGYDKRMTSREFHVYYPTNAYAGTSSVLFKFPSWSNG